jgi:hypothetical protein
MATALRPAVIADTFEAFAIVSGPLTGKGATVPLAAAETREDCLRLSPLVHKQYFFIRHTCALTGAVMLSFYVVKKAKPVMRFHEHQHRMVADLYAEHLFDLSGEAL